MPRPRTEYPSGVDFPRNRLLTLNEVGQVLGLKYSATRQLVVVGALPVVRLAGQSMRVRPRDLEEFIASGGMEYAPRGRTPKTTRQDRQGVEP